MPNSPRGQDGYHTLARSIVRYASEHMLAHSAPRSGDPHWATFSTLIDFANEADVEHRLVMPLLEALGFEGSDIALKVPVTFTRGTKVGRPFEADFVTYSGALHDRDTSLMVVEVKAPNKPLEDAREQGESYAFQLRAPVLLVTNGGSLQVWQLQVSQESTLVLETEVTSLLAKRAEVERVISKQALLHHAESLAFKKLAPSADFLAYEKAELTRAQEPAIDRRLKTAQGEEVQSTTLLKSFQAGALIIAPSGYGKTTLSRQLITAAIKTRWGAPNAPIVVDIPLIDFAQSKDGLVEFFFHRVNAQQPEVTLASVKRTIQDHGAVVVCDGLEYVLPDARQGVDSRLRLFRRDFPSGQLFVFSRAAIPTSLDLPRLTLERLNGDERYALAKAVTGTDTSLWQMPRLLHELSEIPLLLRRMIDYFAERDTFPNRLEDLFEHWLSQLRDGLAGTPASKAGLDSALLSIARETARRRLSMGDALSVVVTAGLGRECFDDLVNSGAVVLTDSSVGLVHDALGDYLRARALAALPHEQFNDVLSQMQIQDDSLLPVLLVSMTRDQASRQLIWKRLEALPLRRYIDTIRFGLAGEQIFSADNVPQFLSEMVEGIEGMLRGFFPAIADVVRASLAHSPFPVEAIMLRGNIGLAKPQHLAFTIIPSSSKLSGMERAFPVDEHWYRQLNLELMDLRPSDGRYMAACNVRDALEEVIRNRSFRGGTLLANERALSRLRLLHSEYDFPLTSNDSLTELIDRFLPHSNDRVSPSIGGLENVFTIQSVVEDLDSLLQAGREKLDWWWLTYGSNEQEIFNTRANAKAYLQAHYSRVTELYAEIVRASFGQIDSAFSYFHAMPFRWEIRIQDRPSPLGHHTINWQWIPVENESQGEPLCVFTDEAPTGLFDYKSQRIRLRSELLRLNRHPDVSHMLGGGGLAPVPNQFNPTLACAAETSAMTGAAEMINHAVKALFEDLPSKT